VTPFNIRQVVALWYILIVDNPYLSRCGFVEEHIQMNNFKSSYTLHIQLIFSIILFSSPSLAASNYTCSNIDSFNTEIQTLNNDYEAARKVLVDLKKKFKTLPTNELIKSEQNTLTQLEDIVKKIKLTIKSAATSKSSKSTSPGIQQLGIEISDLDKKISALDAKIKTLKNTAGTEKQKNQKEIDNIILHSVNPQMGNIIITMPSSANTSVKDSASLSNWIIEQENKINTDIPVIRGSANVSVSFDQLKAKELVQYNLITSAQINQYKSQLNKLLARQAVLSVKIDDGSAKVEEVREYSHNKQRRIIPITTKLYNEFEKEFTDVLSRLSDLGTDVAALKKIEDAMVVKTKLDDLAIDKIEQQKSSLDAQKQLKDVARTNKLKGSQTVDSKGMSSSDKLKIAEEEVNKQRQYVAALKSKRNKWDQAKKKYNVAKTALNNKKSQEADIDLKIALSEKRAIRDAIASAKAIEINYNTKRDILRKRFAIIKELLDQKREVLIKEAKQQIKNNLYTNTNRSKLLKAWHDYKQQLEQKTAPQRKNANKLKQVTGRKIHDVATSLDPYNCNQFQDAVAYRTKLLSVADKLYKGEQTIKPNVLTYPINFPNVTISEIAGYWNSNHGCTHFKQKGSKVKGLIHYTNGGKGQTSGIISSNTYYFKWKNRAISGDGVLKLSTDGTKLSGYHRDIRGIRGKWYLSKRNRPCPR